MPLERIILIRHAATKFNVGGMIQGQLDAVLQPGYGPLVDRLADRLVASEGPPSVLIASDLTRSNLTANRLAQRLRRRFGYRFDYIATPALRERGQGDLEGKSFQEAFPHLPPTGVYAHLFQAADVPGGESLEAVGGRLTRLVEDHLDRYQGTAIVVGHLLVGMNYLRNLLVHGNLTGDRYREFKNLAEVRLELRGRRYVETEP